MKGPDGRSKLFIDKKFAVCALAVALLLIGLQAYGLSKPSGVYTNCTELRDQGHYNIPFTSPLYRPALDRNHNKVACELH